MTTAGPTGYPSSWRPANAPPPDIEPSIEAIALAVDAYLSALSDEEFTALVERVRNGQQQYGQQQPPYGQQAR